jgi:chemotaxis protein methyltransferase CheR
MAALIDATRAAARSPTAAPAGSALSPASFRAVSDLFHRISGIRLGAAKQALVAGRLQRLAQEAGEQDIDAYVTRLMSVRDERELTRVVDRLTTNETYFFREPQHFDLLARHVAQAGRGDLRVWSAASSSGEEVYSLAMVLAEHAPAGWEVLGTDLSTAMVASGQRGLYPLSRARDLPQALLRRWCLRGEGRYEGHLLIARELRQRTRFRTLNLTEPLPDLGRFDVIFLRNVLIYFDAEAKADIVRRVLGVLKPGGLLFTGHAESLSNLELPVRAVAPAVYTHA